MLSSLFFNVTSELRFFIRRPCNAGRTDVTHLKLFCVTSITLLHLFPLTKIFKFDSEILFTSGHLSSSKLPLEVALVISSGCTLPRIFFCSRLHYMASYNCSGRDWKKRHVNWYGQGKEWGWERLIYCALGNQLYVVIIKLFNSIYFKLNCSIIYIFTLSNIFHKTMKYNYKPCLLYRQYIRVGSRVPLNFYI